MSHYSLLITSCNRFDLLKQTLDSFIGVECGGLKPRDTFIVDDSDAPKPEWLEKEWPYYSSHLGKITWISNECRRGHIYSADRLWSLCTQDHAFWMEDDWQFNQCNFMRESFAILAKYPKILTVSLRGDTGWHQLIDQPPFEGFKVCMPGWKGGWGGFTFNCGVRRKSDYLKLGSYGKHVGYGINGLGHERDLSKKLLNEGYLIADLNRKIVEHTGDTRSRATDGWTPAIQKILIAVPVGHTLSYGTHEGDHTNNCDAKNYHFSGRNERIQAVRDTWWKDIAKFPNVTAKFFYGGNGGREPLSDEVFLDVPDDYVHLPDKTIAICKYAKANGYDLLFKCDDDSLINVDRIIQEGIGIPGEYGGYVNGHMCTGGTGYWLTRKAFTLIADAPRVKSGASEWAEDWHSASVMRQNNIKPVHMHGHYTGREQHWFWPENFDHTTMPEGASAFHAVQPHVMRQWYSWKQNAT